MANDIRCLSIEDEAKLLAPIDEYIGKIQEQIDALRVDGSDRVQALKTHIALTKEDKNYTKQEQQEIICRDKEQLKKAKEIENKNKDKVSGLIADAEAYLAAHYKNDYYKKVADSCAAAKKAENAEYEGIRERLKAEHTKALSELTERQEIKDEKYVYKNRLYDAQMVHESKLQEIKDRKHEAFVHEYHLIDLLRMSKFTYAQRRKQKLENYKYTFNTSQFLYKNGLYIVIILIFIALCFITPIVKNTQLLTMANILNILQQASPRVFLALGVAGLILLTGTDLSVGRMVGMGMVTATINSSDNSVTFWKHEGELKENEYALLTIKTVLKNNSPSAQNATNTTDASRNGYRLFYEDSEKVVYCKSIVYEGLSLTEDEIEAALKVRPEGNGNGDAVLFTGSNR